MHKETLHFKKKIGSFYNSPSVSQTVEFYRFRIHSADLRVWCFSKAKSAPARPGDRLNGSENGKTQLLDSF